MTKKRIILGSATTIILFVMISQLAGESPPSTAPESTEPGPSIEIPVPPEPETTDHTAAEAPVKQASDSMLVEVSVANGRMMFLIDAEYLEKAERNIQELEAELAFPDEEELYNPDEIWIRNHPTNFYEQIFLRLGLNLEQHDSAYAVLARYPELEAERINDIIRGNSEQLSAHMLRFRDDLVILGALEMMENDGQEITLEQQVYMEEFERLYFEKIESMDTEMRISPWHENDALLAELNEVLTPTQQQALEVFREEKEFRQKQESAFSRSMDLSEDLALNEADRYAIFEYLMENPDATQEDLTEMLAPELRELIPQTEYHGGCIVF